MKELSKANMLIINDTIYVAIACYDNLQRVVIRDNKKELQSFLSCQPGITVGVFEIKTVARYSFKSKRTRYYTLKEFLSS